MKKVLFCSLLFLLCTQTGLSANITPSPRVIFDGDSGQFSLEWPGEPAYRIEGLTCAVKVDGKWITPADFDDVRWTQTQTADRITIGRKGYEDNKVRIYELMCSGYGPLEYFRLRIERGFNRRHLAFQADAKAKRDYKLGGFKLLTPAKDGGIISLPGNRDGWTVFAESISGPWIGKIFWPHQIAESKEKTHQAVWVSSVQNDKANKTLAMAAIGGELWPTNFHWSLPEDQDAGLLLTIRSGSENELENIVVHSGRTTTSDAVMLGYWRNWMPQHVLINVGGIMGRHVRQGKPMRRPGIGWSSWHSYGRDVTEEGVIKAADAMKENMQEFGYDTIQLDGGWWPTQGLYTANEDFPHGIKWLSQQVHKRGLKFGLHISPFRVAPSDPRWKKNPEWIFQPYGKQEIDLNDEEMITTLDSIYLDGSHPAVAPWLADKFGRMARDWKVDFFKWDHHYGGLTEGDRYDPTMTGLQSHNKVVRAIKAAIPQDIPITRSMGYILGAIECYDSLRVGKDINHPGVISDEEPYANMTYGQTGGTLADVDTIKTKGLIRQARAVSQNFYLHDQVIICDPDATFASPSYTLEEARCHITLNALMGGLFFTGDRIESLPPDRMKILTNKRVLDMCRKGKHAIPLDLFSGVDIPRLWMLKLEKSTVVGIFNWLDDPSEDKWDFVDLGLAATKYKALDLWTGKEVRLSGRQLKLKQQPHTVRLIEFKEAGKQGRQIR